jgi:hypothetical protein
MADLHGNDNMDNLDFISSIHVKEEQIEVDDNLEEEEEVRLNDTLKPFESYSDNKMDESYNHNSLNNSDDLTGEFDTVLQNNLYNQWKYLHVS